MGKKAARTYGAATLAVGTVASVCLMTAPAASAADTTDTRTDTPVVAANTMAELRGALDRARGIFDRGNQAVSDAQAQAQKLREQAQDALRDVEGTLGLTNENVVALTDFVNELNSNAEALKSVIVSMPDLDGKDADTLDEVTLTMTTEDGNLSVTTLENLTPEMAKTIRAALEGVAGNVAVETTAASTQTSTSKQAVTTTSKAATPTPTPKQTSTKVQPKQTTTKASVTSPAKSTETAPVANDAASLEQLRQIVAALEAAKTDNPQVIAEMLERLQQPAQPNGEVNNVTGKNVNTVQNINANTGTTSVAINVTPDGELSISAAQGGKDGNKAGTVTGDAAVQDAETIIAALNNLAAALRGEDAPAESQQSGSTTVTPAATIETPDQAAQRDRLRRALLALTSAEREANSPASRERDALIMIARDLQDGKDISLDDLTTEQMLQVMDWLQNGIPELTKPDATATATATTANTTATTQPTATAVTSTTTEPTSTTTAQTGVVTVTETASPTTTTTTSKKKDKDSDEADETDDAKELASAINGLAKDLADRYSTAVTTTPSKDGDDAKRSGNNADEIVKVNSTSTTRVPAKNAGNTGGGGSGSGSSSNGGSGSGNTAQSNGNAVTSNATGGGNAAAETAAAAPAAENADNTAPMQAEAVSEELAVTGNSTQRMLMLLTLLGSVAAAALFIAMRRTRAE